MRASDHRFRCECQRALRGRTGASKLRRRRAARSARRVRRAASATRLGVTATQAGSLRLPRCGTGARNGRRSRRAAGRRARTRPPPAARPARGKGHDAGSEMWKPTSSARRASSASPVKQCNTPRTSARAVLARMRERVVVGLARVDDDRQVAARAPGAICAREHRLLDVARREVVVVVEADLADRARPRGCASSAARPRLPRPRRVPSANCAGACGWTPIENRTSGQARATAAACAQLRRRRRPRGCTGAASTPAARARRRPRRGRRRTPSSARWQWESIMALARLHRASSRARLTDPRARAPTAARRTRRGSACRPRGSPRAPCRSTRCPSASPASGWRRSTIVRPTSASGSYASAMPATIVRCSVPTSTVSFISFFDFGTRSAVEHLRHAQVDLHEVVDGDAACRRRGAAGAASAAPGGRRGAAAAGAPAPAGRLERFGHA